MKQFWLCFVPLFVAVDAIGVLPMFLGLTQDMRRQALKRVVRQSVATAAAVGVTFLVLGRALLQLLEIGVADFMVAGGVLLFVISMNDLVSATQKSQRQVDPESVGAVPIGVPLITGPAVLTTSLLLRDQHGFLPTVVALVLNVFIAGFVFFHAHAIHRFLGKAGARTVSKIASLLLAAIAVMVVRRGLSLIIRSAGA